MRSIIELNQKEISAIAGGGKLGDCFGYLGAAAGLGIYGLEQIRGNKGTSIKEFYTPVLFRSPVVLTKAAIIVGTIAAFQLGGSYVLATVGNIMEWFYEKIFWSTK